MTLALLTVQPYPVSARGLVQLVDLVFCCLTTKPVPAVYNHSTETNDLATLCPGAMDPNLSAGDRQITCWSALVVNYLLLLPWCANGAGEQLGAGGETGKEMHNANDRAVLKLTLYFSIFNWNPAGWREKHLLDNWHCIHRKWTEYTAFDDLWFCLECKTSLVLHSVGLVSSGHTRSLDWQFLSLRSGMMLSLLPEFL